MAEPHDEPAGGADTAAERTAFLRRHALFQDLPDVDIVRLCESAELVEIAAGDVLMREGEPGDGLYVILRGELEVSRRDGVREIVLGMRGVGDVVGEKALLEQSPRSATIRAHTPAFLLRIRPDAFFQLLAKSPRAAITIIRTLTGRLRSTQALLMARDKLASLGTLAAGLAHELNNPAAAIRRNATRLAERLADLRESTLRLGEIELPPAQVEAIRGLAARSPVSDPGVGTLARSALEEELADWLERSAVPEPWEAAPALLAYGIDAQQLEALRAAIDSDAFSAVMRWLTASLEARQLVDETGASADAISAIVKAVKTYSFMDRAPVQQVDLHEGLEDTLRIMRYRLAQGVEVMRSYDSTIPRIEAYGGELNQVWTNLIDNAIDAMDGQGTIEVGTRRAGDNVVVAITDSGPGIAPELHKRVFDPFYTTKDPGRGSGLGLHIVHNIVVEQHGGRVDIDSRPGGMRFEVTLPIRLQRPAR